MNTPSSSSTAGPSPVSYKPPQYLIDSSGLTAAQLIPQFKAFRDSLAYVSTAPELIFERVLANVFAISPRPGRAQTDGDLRIVLEALQAEVKDLQDLQLVEESSVEVLPISEMMSVPGPATTIRLAFVGAIESGLGVQASSFVNVETGSMGCSWSDVGYSCSGMQYGDCKPSRGCCRARMPWRKQEVMFSPPFLETPKVAVWLTSFDIHTKTPCWVRVSVISVDKTKFTFITRGTSIHDAYAAGVSWVAYRGDNLLQSPFTVQADNWYKDQNGIHGYHGRRTPCKGLLVVDEIMVSSDAEFPLTLSITKLTNDAIHWDMSPAMDRLAFCSLGVKYITW